MDAGAILDQIVDREDLREVQVPLAPAAAQGPKQAIQKVNYSHDGMINLILANRGISQNALAAHFGYSASWISQVMSSDAFQARLAERAAEIEDPTLRATAEEGFKGLLRRSMELLRDRLDKPEVADNMILRTAELSAKALGYGAKEPALVINHNVVENHLEVLGERLTGLLVKKKSESTHPILELQS